MANDSTLNVVVEAPTAITDDNDPQAYINDRPNSIDMMVKKLSNGQLPDELGMMDQRHSQLGSGEADDCIAAIEDAFTQRSVNGFIQFDELPLVLSCGGLMITDEDVRLSVEAVFSERVDEMKASGFSYSDVLELHRFLAPIRGRANGKNAETNQKSKLKEMMEANYLGQAKRKIIKTASAIQEFFVTMKPTNRLVLVIILISILMAMTVAGTAIGLSWMQSMKSQNDALRGDMDLVLHAMQEFGFRQIRQNSLQNAASTAVILKSVIQAVGYHLNLQTANSSQLNGANVAANLVDDLLDTATKRWVMISAMNLASTLDELCWADPTFNGVSFLNTMNKKRLRDAHEAMLIRNDTSTGVLSVLTDLRYPTQCPNHNCDLSLMASAMKTSLVGSTGSLVSIDYTSVSMYMGYSYIPCMKMGLLYKVSHPKLQEAYINDTVNALNSVNKRYVGSTEMMVQLPSKPGYPLTKLKLDTTCTNCTFDQAGYSAVSGAMEGLNPTAIDVDYRQSGKVLSTAAKMNFLDAFLVVKIDVDEVASYVLLPISEASKEINPSFNGSQELLFGYRTSSTTYKPLSDFKWASQCPNNTCSDDKGLYEAVVLCHNDVDISTDYRGKSVVSAQMCIPDLKLGAVMKFDESEIFDSTVQHMVDYANAQNQFETKSSMELMVGMKTSDAYGQTQPSILTNLKYPDSCKSSVCMKQANNFEPMAEALKGKEGDMITTDYRGKKVMSFYSNSNSIGLVFKVDSDEVERPLVINLIIVLFTALGIVMIGNLVLGVAAHRMLASIQSTWDRSILAVKEQKENFEVLLAALYPKFVKDRLVEGETTIFLELSEATVFFSDICNFTMMSNQLTAQELLGWIGYTFGVMDRVANYYAIYKIKTIGDAYLAVAGLPGLIPDGEKDYHSLRMLQFASTVIQIFSGRYTHPDSGACLELIASHSAVLRKDQKAALKTRKGSLGKGSIAMSAGASSAFSYGSAGVGGNGRRSMQAMRYGIAAGPLTVGVLPGKCPAFDVWGKTVNLACRMESTGKANCIHVSEAVYVGAMKSPGSTFTFEKPHATFAKGFGNVPAYFVYGTTENPPKALLMELSLEPAMGDYIFDRNAAPPGKVTNVAHYNPNNKDDVASSSPASLNASQVPTDPGCAVQDFDLETGAPTSGCGTPKHSQRHGVGAIPPVRKLSNTSASYHNSVSAR